jgi:hypothetical protein
MYRNYVRRANCAKTIVVSYVSPKASLDMKMLTKSRRGVLKIMARDLVMSFVKVTRNFGSCVQFAITNLILLFVQLWDGLRGARIAQIVSCVQLTHVRNATLKVSLP